MQKSRMRVFGWLWLGQSVSSFGSGLSAFAVGVWLFQKTGAVTPLALAVLFGTTPGILLAPLAGVAVDRYDRKRIMLLSDAGQAVTVLLLLIVVMSVNVSTGAVYALLAVSSAVGALQWPAEQATMSLLVPAGQLGRANGLQSLGEGAATLVAPISAGLLVPTIGISGTIVIDLATFVFSAVILVFLKIPNPVVSAEQQQKNKQNSVLEDIKVGWEFIRMRRGLVNLLSVGTALNLVSFFVTFRLVTPMVLSRTNDATTLGWIGSAFGLGLLSGGLLMSVWGGPERKIYGVAAAIFISGLLGQALFGLSSSVAVWLLAVFSGSFVIALQGGCANAIWQLKTPKNIQGRVFSLRRLISQFTAPIGLLLIGPLADLVLQPFWKSYGPNVIGRWPGTLPGGGYALAFVAFGVLSMLIACVCLLTPSIRSVESDVPDAE